MFKYDILIKSGTSGHYDYDNCDLVVKSDFESSIPLSVGDVLMVKDREYIVNEIIVSEHYNVCYVLRIYDSEDKRYIRAFDRFTSIVVDDPDVKNEQLRDFSRKWIKDRREGIIRL